MTGETQIIWYQPWLEPKMCGSAAASRLAGLPNQLPDLTPLRQAKALHVTRDDPSIEEAIR